MNGTSKYNSLRLDPAVEAILNDFESTWSNHLGISPLLCLDGSWPSISTIDLLTFGFRGARTGGQQAEQLLRGCAAYLARFIGHCWAAAGAVADIDIDSQEGIRVRAHGGPHLAESAELSMSVEAVLREILIELPNPFPVFRDGHRPVSFDSNLISLLALGACTGKHPAVHGRWLNEGSGARHDEDSVCTLICRELARQSADFYSRVFPEEPLGAIAELYLSPIVYPPILIGEELPAERAAHHVLDYAEQFNIKQHAVRQLAKNWALLHDDTLSSVGLALYGAAVAELPDSDTQSSAQGRSAYMALLRHTMVESRRRLFDNQGDWVVEGLKTPNDRLRFAIEQEMGFLPWLRLPVEWFEAKEHWEPLRPLLFAVCSLDLDRAMNITKQLLEGTPTDQQLQLQRITFLQIAGDLKSADTLARRLLSEPTGEQLPELHYCIGISALEKGDLRGALKSFRTGLQRCPTTHRLYPELANNCGWALLLLERFEESLKSFDLGLQHARYPVTLLLNKAHALWQMCRWEEADAIRRKLFQIAPCDRRVFASVATTVPTG